MVADIARVTYDPTRHYRSLITQQGRVTLEADNNESVMLETEALRLETIDIIGPSGTPDNGYAVSSGSGPSGITVGNGIFYLGGWRLELNKPVGPIDLANQPDWIDQPVFNMPQGVPNLAVALLLTEQSVGAIEDRALREVALGGPDSAARARLMQHFLRVPMDGVTCAVGDTTIEGLLNEDGVKVDPATLRLMSTARLQAGFVAGPASTDPCTPAAAGGYLGADNQMVRVTVTEYTPSSKTLLWGWNNASLLYRAAISSDGTTVTLIDTPVDQEHAPQQNQIVEILRTSADLHDGNYIADCQGEVRSVAQAYSFDTQQLVLKTAVTADYLGNADPLFVRLWQAEVKFQAGAPTPLDNVSGITVAITMDALPTHIAARPFWHFAVRPSMPQNIYPQRYADAPQPPDGPRQWITELAVLQLGDGGWKLLADCRTHFLPLTKQHDCSCCGLVLGPNEVAGRGGLQAVVDGLAGSAAVLSLRTGTYPLSAPLKLGERNSGLTIEGCTGGVILTAAGTDLTPFRPGMIVLNDVANITLRQLQFNVPAVPLGAGDYNVQLATMCGLLVGNLQAPGALTVEACIFVLDPPSVYAFGAGIIVLGFTERVSLLRNIFVCNLPAGKGGAEVGGVLAVVTEEDASAALDDWQICENIFADLAWGVIAFAQLGLVVCSANVVFGCATGLLFIEANLGETNGFTYEAMNDPDNAVLGQAAYSTLRPDLLANMVDKVKPIQSTQPAPTTPAVSSAARKVLADQLKSKGAEIYKTMAAGAVPAVAAQRAAKAPVIDTASFDKMNDVALAAELAEVELTPALRIEDNEVTLSAAVTTPWLGIGAILSPDEPGSVLVRGNRVAAPDATTMACGLLLPAGAVVTGNLFAQLAAAPEGSTLAASLLLITNSPAIMVAANVIVYTDFIVPQRSSTAATTTWEFLNTVV